MQIKQICIAFIWLSNFLLWNKISWKFCDNNCSHFQLFSGIQIKQLEEIAVQLLLHICISNHLKPFDIVVILLFASVVWLRGNSSSPWKSFFCYRPYFACAYSHAHCSVTAGVLTPTPLRTGIVPYVRLRLLPRSLFCNRRSAHAHPLAHGHRPIRSPAPTPTLIVL